MTYWTTLAETYNAELLLDKEIVTADTTPVQKAQRQLNWSNPLGDVSFRYFHHEHTWSHSNSTYSELEIQLVSKKDFGFKLTKLDVFEKFYAKVLHHKKARLIGNFLLKSNELNKARRIVDTLPIGKYYLESVELKTEQNISSLHLITREDFLRNQNAGLYIDFLIKIAERINDR